MSLEQPGSYTPESAEGAITDTYPTASVVDPVFATEDPEGVDVVSMPAVKDVRRLRPSARLVYRAKLAKIAEAVPENAEDMAQVDPDNISVEDMAKLAGQMDDMAKLFELMEDLVFDLAEDPREMEEWLLAQDDPESAVSYAFSRVSSALGKVSQSTTK